MIASEAQLSRLETILGGRLPSDYREFMLTGDVATIEDLDYWMPHPNGRWIETVLEFHTAERLLPMMEMEIDLKRKGFGDHPHGTLPIANDGCGDSVLISYRDQDFGAIFHEFLEEGDMDDAWRGVYLLAPSFKDWMNMLSNIPKDEES